MNVIWAALVILAAAAVPSPPCSCGRAPPKESCLGDSDRAAGFLDVLTPALGAVELLVVIETNAASHSGPKSTRRRRSGGSSRAGSFRQTWPPASPASWRAGTGRDGGINPPAGRQPHRRARFPDRSRACDRGVGAAVGDAIWDVIEDDFQSSRRSTVGWARSATISTRPLDRKRPMASRAIT